VDAVRSDVQEPPVPVGPAGRALGQLQGGQKPGHRPKEALPPGVDGIRLFFPSSPMLLRNKLERLSRAFFCLTLTRER